jgi:Spx/MgsR family transcriptional regulator
MSSPQPAPTTGIVLYGIETCDTCRQARRWLTSHGVAYRFHDLRRDGLQRSTLEGWLGRIAWEELPNRRGQTWRRLDARTRDALCDAESLIAVAIAEPLVLRRPVLDDGAMLLVGYSDETYAARVPHAR